MDPAKTQKLYEDELYAEKGKKPAINRDMEESESDNDGRIEVHEESGSDFQNHTCQAKESCRGGSQEEL
ncbi:hypothetical protein QVD17_14090 [Tagetes erecta]|uniref:Uncharacterized protein n=1 Tax=Tagetes erecta TaxID=13708 RepID=A0AAD8NWI4_TARER|nr:hypothetical protein QVD17_14090 [Tagetes erecta]